MIPKPIILDISEWQVPQQMNYDLLARAIDGAIIRVQYGEDYEDHHYQTHIRSLQARKIPVAVYAWVRGTSISDMRSEARRFWQRAQQFQPVFWWLDVEEQSMTDMQSGCEAYRQELKALGAKKIGAYIANHLYRKFQLDTAKFDGIWLPTYGKDNGQYEGSNPTATADYHLHQYTSAGRLPGYAGNLDLSRVAQGSFATFFGQQTQDSKPTTQGGKMMKQLQLTDAVYLRRQPSTGGAQIALLQKDQQIQFEDVHLNEGYLWGEQKREDGTKGYLAIGKITAYGKFTS